MVFANSFHVYCVMPSAKVPQRISSKHQMICFLSFLLPARAASPPGRETTFLYLLIMSLLFLLMSPPQGHLSEGYGKLCSIYLKLLITKMEFHIKVSHIGL